MDIVSIEVINVSDIVEANGKTWRENNLAIKHSIPIGTLVEVKFDSWFGEGACWKVHARLWVVAHTRDCDGTPLYSLSRWRDPILATSVAPFKFDLHSGFDEAQLTPVAVTPNLAYGHDALQWDEK